MRYACKAIYTTRITPVRILVPENKGETNQMVAGGIEALDKSISGNLSCVIQFS